MGGRGVALGMASSSSLKLSLPKLRFKTLKQNLKYQKIVDVYKTLDYK